MAKRKLSRDQKRKAKLAKRAKRHEPQNDLAYHGDKFKTDELSEVYFATERGIREADVTTSEALTDRTVEKALTTLIQQIRQGALPPPSETLTLEPTEESAQDLIVANVRRNWDDLFQSYPRPGRDTLIGLLRTLLGSIEVWSTPSRKSRGYLAYLKGFLKQTGSVPLHLRGVRFGEGFEEGDWEASEDQDEVTAAEDLLAIGQAWYRGGEEFQAEEFNDLAEEMLEMGEADQVAEVCQQLIGEAGMCEAFPTWSAWSLRAQEVMRQADRQDVPSPAALAPPDQAPLQGGGPTAST